MNNTKRLRTKGSSPVVGRIKAMFGPLNAPSALGLVFVLSMVQELSQAAELDEVAALPEQADLQQIVATIQDSYPEISTQLFPDSPTDVAFDAGAVAAELAELQASGYLSQAEAQSLVDTLNAMDAGSAWAVDSAEDIQLAQAAPDVANAVEGQAGVSGAAATAVPAAEGTAAAPIGVGAAAVGAAALPPGVLAAGGLLGAMALGGGGGGGGAVVPPIVAKAPGASGTVSDGYVKFAKIYVDSNGNGIADASEDTGKTTDATGKFQLDVGVSGPIIAVGGTNIDTGLANTLVLKAAAGSTMVTPLTTLVQAYIQANSTGGKTITLAQANAAVVNALGFTAGTDLATYDSLAALKANPSDANALAVQQAASEIATIITLAASNPLGASTDGLAAANVVIGNLVSVIDSAATGNTVVDLTNTVTIATVLDRATDVTVATVVAATTSIDTATTLEGVSSAQLVSVATTVSGTSTLVLTASTETTSIDGVIAAGNVDHNITTLDLVDNATVITDAQASSLVLEGIHFASNDAGVAVQAVGTHLTTSLSDLQKLGVDVVNVGVTSGEFVIAAGTGAIDFAHLPTVVAGPAVQVGLAATGATFAGLTPTQITAEAALLHTAGFDNITAADGTLAVDSALIQELHAGGLSFVTGVAVGAEGSAIGNVVSAIDQQIYTHNLDVLDLVSNAVTITDAQASSLISAGIHFAADDTAVAVQAVGTHLTTSLSSLQALGVDVVNVGVTSGEFVIGAGTGAIDFAHLPTVVAAPAVQVGLAATSATFAGLTPTQITAEAALLHTAGFDNITAADSTLAVDSALIQELHAGGMSFVTGVAVGAEGSAIGNVVSAIDQQIYTHNLDVLDLVSNTADITDAQASSLISAGIHFAADDTGVAVHAVGTHLTTSLHDLQALGVDLVHTDHTTNVSNTVVLDMGTGAFAGSTLPVFDTADHVQLNVLDTQLSSLETLITANANAANIDVLSVVLNDSIGTELGGLGVLDPSLHGHGLSVELNVAFASSAVTLGMVLEAADGIADPLALLHGQTLADALVAAGISDIKIDHITSFEVSDTDLKPLMDAGLINAEAGANITVDHAGVGTLDVTLAQLAGIGADHVVQTGGVSLAVDAGVTFTGLTGLETELNKLLTKFEDPITGIVNKQLFVDANTVDLHVAGTLASGEVLSTALAAQLTLLGIDHVLDDHGNTLK